MMTSCIKRLFPGVQDVAHLVTLCQPQSESHAVICAYTTAKPGETLAEFTARWEADRIATGSDPVEYCPACLKAFAESEQPWRVEFGPEFAVPAEIQAFVDSGVLLDTSYGNDICPSFEFAKNRDLRIWVDFPDPSTREMQGKRFMVTFGEGEKDFDNRMIMTDELGEVVALCEMTGSGFEITMKDGSGETVEPRPISELSPKTRSRIVRGLGNHLMILLREEHLRKMPIQAVEVFDEGKAMTVRLRDILVPVESLRMYAEAITRRPDKPGWSIEETIANTAIMTEVPPCESFASPVATAPGTDSEETHSPDPNSDHELTYCGLPVATARLHFDTLAPTCKTCNEKQDAFLGSDFLDKVAIGIVTRRSDLRLHRRADCLVLYTSARVYRIGNDGETWKVLISDLNGRPIEAAFDLSIPTTSENADEIADAVIEALIRNCVIWRRPVTAETVIGYYERRMNTKSFEVQRLDDASNPNFCRYAARYVSEYEGRKLDASGTVEVDLNDGSPMAEKLLKPYTPDEPAERALARLTRNRDGIIEMTQLIARHRTLRILRHYYHPEAFGLGFAEVTADVERARLHLRRDFRTVVDRILAQVPDETEWLNLRETLRGLKDGYHEATKQIHWRNLLETLLATLDPFDREWKNVAIRIIAGRM